MINLTTEQQITASLITKSYERCEELSKKLKAKGFPMCAKEFLRVSRSIKETLRLELDVKKNPQSYLGHDWKEWH